MTEPNYDEVICPKCCEQFRAVPVNVQAEIETLRDELTTANRGAERNAVINRELARELAALKAGQGEPATEVVDLRAEFPAGAICPPLPVGTRLYTAPTFPEGWQLVPMEPTPEMVKAGRDLPVADTGDDDVDAPQDYINVYRAMLSAATGPKERTK